MKCLTVCQPFADLIVSGKKTIELRSWNTRFRGEFLVHAAQSIRRDDARRLKAGSKFVTGAIVGKTELVGVKRYETESELRGDYKRHLASKEFQKSRYGFVLKNPKKFRVPVPYKGRLGLFEAGLPDGDSEESAIIADIADNEYRYQWIGHH